MSDGKPALLVLNLTVVYRPTNSIKPELRNARMHSKKQVAEIAASIRQFGFSNPLLIDADGVLIGEPDPAIKLELRDDYSSASCARGPRLHGDRTGTGLLAVRGARKP